jgi:DnaJ-class molecular chaperone
MGMLLRPRKSLKNYYAILGVSPSASPKAIQQAFRKEAQKYHPDVNPDPGAIEIFQELVEAYRTLNGPERRDEYDEKIISEFCHAYLGSFESDAPKKKTRPMVLQAWRGSH